MNENAIGTLIVDCAIELHRDLGPGLLETVYEVTLARALERRGLVVQRQVGVAIEYRGERFDEGFRADLIVENPVIVELKSVERVTPAHKKQVLTYLRLTGLKLGYLLNFGEALMRDGITRIIHGYLDSDPPCLGASVREEFIEPGSAASPARGRDR
ncbi:MAG TPA: GxxExxY protein [Candidatus Paceibacterota bacterium]|nr:GxxExxY protein [Verrucomicrobiota bacterium]HRY49375.1 GxxExxY protein [Candidatus Paceibacterota bacterium]